MTINLTDLFGANASQTEQTLTIDKNSLGLGATAKAEQALAALVRNTSTRVPSEAITTNGVPITVGGFPLVAVEADRTLITKELANRLIYRSGQVYRSKTIEITELTPYAGNI